MFKGLKNLANDIKKEVEKYQNIYNAAKSGITPTAEDVKTWVADELDKLNIPNSYLVHFASPTDYADLYKSVYNDTVKYYREKAGVLNKFKFVRDFITGMGQGAAQRTECYMGITTFREEAGTDEVIFYIDHIVRYWGTLAFEQGDTPEEITRQVVRHEIRHAHQFNRLRQIGGSELVRKVWAKEQSISYTARATEADAFGGQRSGYGDLSEFVKLVEKEMGMKLI